MNSSAVSLKSLRKQSSTLAPSPPSCYTQFGWMRGSWWGKTHTLPSQILIFIYSVNQCILRESSVEHSLTVLTAVDFCCPQFSPGQSGAGQMEGDPTHLNTHLLRSETDSGGQAGGQGDCTGLYSEPQSSLTEVLFLCHFLSPCLCSLLAFVLINPPVSPSVPEKTIQPSLCKDKFHSGQLVSGSRTINPHH